MQLLEVERLTLSRNVFGTHGGATNHEDVNTSVDDNLMEFLGVLRRQCSSNSRTGFTHLLDAQANQLWVDLYGVDLLEARVCRCHIE